MESKLAIGFEISVIRNVVTSNDTIYIAMI